MDWSSPGTGAAFWIFIATIAASGVWSSFAARREAQRTIRLAIEKNYPIDAALLEKILGEPSRSEPRHRYGGGAVLMALGIGMPLMGYFIKLGGDAEAFFPLLGVGCMLFLTGAAMFLVAWFSGRNSGSKTGQL